MGAGQSRLSAGEAFRIEGPLQAVGANPEAVFICRDTQQREHAWDHDSRHKVYRRSKRFGRRWYHRSFGAPELYPTEEQHFKHFYPRSNPQGAATINVTVTRI